MNPDNEPISVDLAREADFSAGGLKVRPSLRQVEADGGAETLEPRVMQVLVALFRRRGEVVSRTELIECCWGGRIVGEDAISRCIARVRKLGETHGAFSLETIPRVGYRLTLPAGAGATAPERQAATPAGPLSESRSGVRSLLRKRETWIGTGALLVIAIVAVFLFRGGEARPADADAVVARLTEKLQQRAVSQVEIDRAGAAAKELGASPRAEERSAFAALASGDSVHAVEVLEDLAAKLEQDGDTASAAEVYTRIGAIALVVDQGRGLAARRKAILLAPESPQAFQGLFLDMVLVGRVADALKLAEDTLARPGLSDGMRGWTLAHRGLAETDIVRDSAKAEATRQEIDELGRRTGDELVEYSSVWLGSLLATNRDALREALDLSNRGTEMRARLKVKVSDMTGVTRVRVLLASGDWSGAFASGVASLEERGRTGDFLPSPTIIAACVAGVYAGNATGAEAYCRSLAQRMDNTGGVMPRAYAGLISAALGDARTAAREFAAAEGLQDPASIRPQVWLFEAYAAHKRNDLDEAEKLARQAVAQASAPGGLATHRSFSANALRLLAGWQIAAGRMSEACGPLAEARQLYAEVGGDAGRVAVDALRGAAACR